MNDTTKMVLAVAVIGAAGFVAWRVIEARKAKLAAVTAPAGYGPSAPPPAPKKKKASALKQITSLGAKVAMAYATGGTSLAAQTALQKVG